MMSSGSAYAALRRSVWASSLGALVLLLVALPARAQESHPRLPVDTLYVADYSAYTSVPALVDPSKLGRAAAADIEVQYNGFPAGGAAEAAFQLAVDIWALHITSAVPIRIQANWEDLSDDGEGIKLGAAGPTVFYRDFSGALDPLIWYPVALAEAIRGSALNNTDEFDVVATFNSTYDGWYFGLDANPGSNEIDFVSVVLHEIGHGLGFVGSMVIDNGDDTDGDECPGAPADWGCYGLGAQALPMVYDVFTEDADDISLLNEQVYPNPSLELADVLQSDAAFFDGESVGGVTNDVPVNLYAPENFEIGSTYSHLDEQSFPPGELNSLMTPFLARSEAIHTPGPITCAMFQDMGWPLGADCLSFLSPGLISFDAEESGDRVTLTWETTRGLPVERFEVQRSYFDEDFVTIETIPPDETPEYEIVLEDLDPGRHWFRLKQVFEDGRITFSEEVEVFIELEEDLFVAGPFPNPSRGLAEMSVLVDLRQRVRVEVYNALGHRVVRLFDGFVARGGRQELLIDATGWAPGVYFVYVIGEDATTTKSLVLVR